MLSAEANPHHFYMGEFFFYCTFTAKYASILIWITSFEDFSIFWVFFGSRVTVRESASLILMRRDGRGGGEGGRPTASRPRGQVPQQQTCPSCLSAGKSQPRAQHAANPQCSRSFTERPLFNAPMSCCCLRVPHKASINWWLASLFFWPKRPSRSLPPQHAAIIELKVLPLPQFATLLPVNGRGGTEAGVGK